MKHYIYDGWTFLVPEGHEVSSEPMKNSERLSLLMASADIVIDNRGRCRKNRWGARGAEPVENPSPVVGKIDPLKPNPTLEDRLMLRHATSYRFGGIVDGEGFMVTVSLDLGAEGWGLVKHWEDPHYKSASHPTLTPQILLLDDATSDIVWCPLPNVENYHETHTVMDIEDEKEAIRLALDITDGRIDYPVLGGR